MTMGLGTKLLKNTGYLTAGNQIGNLLQFLFFLLFARQFGKEVVGKYAFAFSFTFVFSVLADLGLSAHLIREVARDRSGQRQIFVRCLILRLFSLAFFSLLATGVIWAFFNHFSKETIYIIVLLGLFQIFFSIADVFLAEFKGHDQMGLVSLLSIFMRLVIAGVGILLIKFGYHFLTVLISFPAGSVVYLILCLYFSVSHFNRVPISFKNIRLGQLFIINLPFTFTIIFSEALYHQDILMLGALQGDQALGIYSAANKMVLMFIGVLIFVHTALLPTFSRLYIESKSKLIEVAGLSLRYLILTGLPIATGCFAISDKLILFLFSDSFRNATEALNILGWTITFGFLAATYSVLMTAINRQKEKGVVIGICLAFNFLFNFLLIPYWSYNGAAISKLMTEALHFFLMAHLISKYFTPISIHKMLFKPAVASLVMYIFIYVFNPLNVIYLIVISPIIYFISLGLLRTYTDEEKHVLKCILSKCPFNKKSIKTFGS